MGILLSRSKVGAGLISRRRRRGISIVVEISANCGVMMQEVNNRLRSAEVVKRFLVSDIRSAVL